ncbi:hypothetical protein PInf_009785 [Phytophthora infestans]|nr:hypothetical protein PInf_009785 [Phytophthora infestans]
MGRGCTMDEWIHFQKLPEEGRVPNSSYWYVLCRHCVAGFQQKKLFNAPPKLTGRRSAMRSHLKVCPMYATQYQMEQQAKAEVEAETGASNSTTTTVVTSAPTSTGEKRKRRADRESCGGSRGGRGKHCMMEEWEHFTRLQDEGYIGKSNFFYALCKCCQRAYDEAPEDQKPLLVPEKLVGRREKMRKHLALCPHFKGDLPPLERRLFQRNKTSVVVSALAAGAAAHLGAVAATSTSVSATADLKASGAAVSPVAAMLPVTSSRLALDEWQHFTRLERKKDSAYYYARCNFCQQAYENAPENLKASMEPAIVMGRKSNMQTHLSKCRHLPKDPSAMAKIHNINLSATASLDASGPKRPEVDVSSMSLAHSADKFSVHRSLVHLVIEHNLPFEWVESVSAKQLFGALVPASDVKNKLIPRSKDLRTRVLGEVHSATLLTELAKLQEPILLEVGASAFSADMVDTLSITPAGSWPVMMHCNLTASHHPGDLQMPVIDGVVTNGNAITSLSFIRAQQPESGVEATLARYHGLEIARWLDGHIRLCVEGTKLALAAVVLPYSTMTQRAVGILRAPSHWPRVAFLSDMEDMLQFPLLKLLASAEMFTVVSSLIEVWQLESIRSCVIERLSAVNHASHKGPFCNWESCATLIQVLLDEKAFASSSTKKGAANAKRLVENALDRSLLERVYNLLHAFTNALSSCRSGQTLSETLEHLGALFTAAEGFVTVQIALEVLWGEMEQPLFVVAHALNPRLRLRDLKSTDITRLSTLSDLSVSYFRFLFGRKPNSLRGEVTAYLHTSQQAFTSEFVAEFPVVEDYFCYLSDNYPSLAMLMKVLHSLCSVSVVVNRSSSSTQQETTKTGGRMYTKDEQQKLNFLRDRWGIASGASSLDSKEEPKDRITAHNDRSGAAMLNAGVVDEWKEALESKLHVRGVDFFLLEDKFDDFDDPVGSITKKSERGDVAIRGDETVHNLKLPSLEQDDELAYPSASLRTEFSMKVLLKDLFKTARGDNLAQSL